MITKRHLWGLFFTSCSLLTAQITWTRVLSVSHWYHFAFLIISVAMLGFGAAGAIVGARPRLTDNPQPPLAVLAWAQAISIIVGYWLCNHLPFEPFSLLSDKRQLLIAAAYMGAVMLPFTCGGIVTTLLLARGARVAGRVYFYDLAGAAFGCGLVLAVLPLGGSRTMAVSAVLSALAAILFASKPVGRVLGVTGAALLLLVCTYADTLLPLRISTTKRYGTATMNDVFQSHQPLYTAWNSFSRVDVLPAPWGFNILIDAGTALTRMPRVTRRPNTLGPVLDERAIVFSPDRKPSVLVIGSGGGWDVLAAMRSQAAFITAVEVNPLINQLVTGRMAGQVGNIFSDPHVRLVTDEARSFIRREKQRYDVILASHSISNAATASGALSLAESYLTTTEAFEDYLRHLNAGGFLWFTRPEAQLARLMTTVRTALQRIGVKDPAGHLIAFANGTEPSFFSAIVASPQPLDTRFLARAQSILGRLPIRQLYFPGAQTNDAFYQRLATADEKELAHLYSTNPTQLAPTHDDAPFFNHRSRWSQLNPETLSRVFRQDARARMAMEDQPVAEAMLVIVLALSLLFAVVAVLPLVFARRAPRQPSEQDRRAAPFLVYFSCLGLGFILVEIALIQRFTLFLGQPVYSFAVIVGGLLVSAGLGSWLSSRVKRLLPAHAAPFCAGAIAICVLLFDAASPGLIRAGLHWSILGRAAASLIALAPLGIVLGSAFPLGIRQAGATAPRSIPWGWALNAIFGVVGSAAATMLATTVGFSGVLVVAAALYALASLSAWRFGKPSQVTQKSTA